MELRRIIKESAVAREQLAKDAGVSLDSLWSWATERRTPTPDNVRKLARGLRVRARKLLDLADELENSIAE